MPVDEPDPIIMIGHHPDLAPFAGESPLIASPDRDNPACMPGNKSSRRGRLAPDLSPMKKCKSFFRKNFDSACKKGNSKLNWANSVF